MRGTVFLSLMAVGCAGSRIRTEHLGTGHGLVTTRAAGGGESDASAAPGGGGMPLPRGTYEIDLRIGVPRAQLVDWQIRCTGAEEQHGQVGQAFDDYRDQRLAELTRQREQQARVQARVLAQPPPPPTTVVVRPRGRIEVATPVGGVVVRPAPVVVAADAPPPPPAPVASDAGDAAIDVPPVTELPPGDLGQGVYPARVRVVTARDGACTITAVADDPNVSAFYSVTRIRDLGVEAAERKQMIYVGAVGLRARVTEQLVAYGADPAAKQRRLEAEARARAEAEARRGAELARQREVELQIDVERRRKADAEAALRRQREAREEAERQRQAEIAAELEERRRQAEVAAAWEAEAPARARAELLIHQKEVSIRWRLTLIAWLVGECHADPDRRGRIARARAQREREAQARLELRLEIERRERERLIRIRMEQDRLELEREREAMRVAREERARTQQLEQERERERLARWEAERAERETRAAIEGARREREARERAELVAHRTHEAVRIRTAVIDSLIGLGAKLRPPMPAPRVEEPGPPPFEGAAWAAGRWEWISLRAEWQWRGGGWRDTTRFGRTGGETVVHTDTVVVAPPPTTTVIVAPPTPPPAVIVGTPAVVIDVQAPRPRPRPTYRPRPRDTYQPKPRTTYQPKPRAQDDDDKRRPRR